MVWKVCPLPWRRNDQNEGYLDDKAHVRFSIAQKGAYRHMRRERRRYVALFPLGLLIVGRCEQEEGREGGW